MASSDIIKIGFDYRSSLAQFEKDTNGVFDGISSKAGKQKITIQLDAKDDKVIDKIKELQKLKLDKFTFEFGNSGLKEQLQTFDKLENKINEIINLSKGIGNSSTPIVDVNKSSKEIDKLESKLSKLSKKYEELQKGNISGKDISLVDNDEFKKLSESFEKIKGEVDDLKTHMSLLDDNTISGESFVKLNSQVDGLSTKLDDLLGKYDKLANAQKNLGNKTNISLGDSSAVKDQQIYQTELSETKKLTDENVSSMYEFIKLCQEQARVLGETNEKLKERAAYFNNEKISGGVSVGTHISGNHDNSNIEGANSDLHSHFSKYASFSESDLYNLKDTIKNFMVMGTDQITHFDTSGLSKDLLEQITIRYDQAVKELNQQYFDNLNIKNNLKFTDIEDIPEQIFEKAFEFAEQQSNIDYDYDKYDSFYDSQVEKIRQKLLDGASLNDIVNSVSQDIKSLDVDGVESEIKSFQDNFVKGIKGYLNNILLENDVFNPDKILGLEEYNAGRNNALKTVLDELGVDSDRLKTIDISNLEEGYSSLLKILGLVVEKQKEVKDNVSTTSQKDLKDAFQGNDEIASSSEKVSNAVKEENNILEQNTQKAKENAEAKEKMANADKEVSNANFSKYDNRLESYNKKTSGYDATIARFEDGGWTSDAYTKNVKAVKDAVAEYERILNNLKAHPELVTEKELSKLDEQEKLIKENITAVQNMSAAEKGFTKLSAQKELDKINNILKEHSGMSREAKNQIKAYYAQIKSGNPSASLDVIHAKIMEIVNAEVEAGRAGKSMFDAIKEKAWYGVASAIGTYFGINDIFRYAKEGIEVVREFDTALTEMKKVSDETTQSLKNYQATTFDTADAVGTTALQIQNSTADYMRLGESLEEASESAKTANILLNVSEFDNIEDATKSLVSMGQAYKDLDKLTIVDKLNEVGRRLLPKHTVMYGIFNMLFLGKSVKSQGWLRPRFLI